MTIRNGFLMFVFAGLLAYVVLLKTGRLDAMGLRWAPAAAPVALPPGALSHETEFVLCLDIEQLDPARLKASMVEGFGEKTVASWIKAFPGDRQDRRWLRRFESPDDLARWRRGFVEAGGRTVAWVGRLTDDDALDHGLWMCSLRDPDHGPSLHQWLVAQDMEIHGKKASVWGHWLVYHDREIDLSVLARRPDVPDMLDAVNAGQGAPLVVACRPTQLKDAAFNWFGATPRWAGMALSLDPPGGNIFWSDASHLRRVHLSVSAKPLKLPEPVAEKAAPNRSAP